MDFLISLFPIVLGLLFGSFLNVVLYRYNTGYTLGGRSACLYCGHTLSWKELFPVFSFLIQKGRCRHCQGKISIQYPVVESLSALLFFLSWNKAGAEVFSPESLFSFALLAGMFSLLLLIAVYDYHHKIIPDAFVYPFAALALMYLFFVRGVEPDSIGTIDLLSGVFISAPFAALWFFSGGKWMGLGDAKLALGIGWLLPFFEALSAIMLSFWIGTIVALTLLFSTGKLGMKSEIPFGPFLVIGTALMCFMSTTLLHFIFPLI